MPRIDTTNILERWRWTCPAPQRHSDWRVVDGIFECRSCGETFEEIVDKQTDERIPWSAVELIDPRMPA